MAYGIRVRNDYFTTQIDHNFKNYGFAQIIPVFVSVDYSSLDEQGLVQITVPGVNALVGVRCSQLYYLPLGSYFDGTNWLYNFKFINQTLGTVAETVQFYVFNTPESVAFSNVGIRIRNPVSGEVAFHSDMRPLYMEAKLPCSSSFFGSSSRVYCPIVTRLSFVMTFVTGVGYRARPYALRCNSSGIEALQVGLPSHYIAFFEYFDAGEYTVIDVTGL